MKRFFKAFTLLALIALIASSFCSCLNINSSETTYSFDEICGFFEDDRVTDVTLTNDNVLEMNVIEIDENGNLKYTIASDGSKDPVTSPVKYKVASRAALLARVQELIDEGIADGTIKQAVIEPEDNRPWWEEIFGFGE